MLNLIPIVENPDTQFRVVSAYAGHDGTTKRMITILRGKSKEEVMARVTGIVVKIDVVPEPRIRRTLDQRPDLRRR